MKKLLQGIIEFREKILPGYRDDFARLAAGQSPDALLIACSDSRVVPNLFASTNPGDLFVVRNVGNLVPPFSVDQGSSKDPSIGAAIAFAVEELKIKDIIVCGHSECGAMQALLKEPEEISPFLGPWLVYGEPAKAMLQMKTDFSKELTPHNRLSQLNTLVQMAHLETYPQIKRARESGHLEIHGWWFEISSGDVYAFNAEKGRFVLLDRAEASRLLKHGEGI